MEFLVEQFCFLKCFSIRANDVAVFAEVKSFFIQQGFCDIKQGQYARPAAT